MDKVERLGDLVAYLLDAERPRSLREILSDVPGYPEAHESARVQFARDRDLLAEEGIDVTTIGTGEDARYRIDPATYYLPDLELTDEEAVALNLAASQVRIEGHDPDEALLKLGGFGVEGAATVALPFDERLPIVYTALRQRAPLVFRYGGVDRVVEAYGMLCRDGNWYVSGFDRTRDARRNFRIDRIEGAVTTGGRGEYEVPPDFDVDEAIPEEPFAMAPDDPVDADVWLDGVMAPRAAGEVLERRADGSVVVRLQVASIPGLRSWLLNMRDHARVLGPPEVVESITSWLRAIAAGGGA
jgi:predicted DNA-binding transcriptional regulator YafY